jgi:predicted nucleic acid-binding protein
MKAFVADASVAIGWVHPGQETANTTALLQAIEDGAIIEVPALWPLEVANVLTVLVRRHKLTEEDERQTALLWLSALPLRIDHEMATLAFSRLGEIATKHQLSIYDAAYLELAQRRNLPLACNDGPLREAASRLSIGLWKKSDS